MQTFTLEGTKPLLFLEKEGLDQVLLPSLTPTRLVALVSCSQVSSLGQVVQ